MTLFENMVLFPESCPWLIIMTNSSLFYLLLFIFYLAVFLWYWRIRWRILELNIGHVAFKWSLRVTCLMCQFGDQPNGMALKWLAARPMTVTGHGQMSQPFNFRFDCYRELGLSIRLGGGERLIRSLNPTHFVNFIFKYVFNYPESGAAAS